MIKAKKRYFISVLAILIFSSNANAIWVHDSTAAVNAVKQIAETKKQIEQMKMQVEQTKALYKSLNGTRGIVDLLKSPLVISKLPHDYQELYSGIKNAKDTKWASLYKLSENGKAINEATPQNIRDAYDSSLRSYEEVMRDSIDSSYKRVQQIDVLAKKINTTKDPKEIADLQAQISSMHAVISVDKMRMDTLREIKQLREQTLRANASKEFRANITKPYKVPDLHIDWNNLKAK